MNTTQEAFNGKAFVAYLTAGQISLDYTVDAACALVEGGVDLLEIGVPFSDPVADGPVIQAAMQQALLSGTNLKNTLMVIKKIKQRVNIPIVLFTYYNPILNFSGDDFYQHARQAGIDGILVVDLPMEESDDYFEQCGRVELAPICVVSPSTSKERLSLINQHAKGFIYYACRNGITGMRNSLPDDFSEKINAIKEVVNLPVACGFGISNQAMAREVCCVADGFVIGSLFVKAIADGATADDLKKMAQSLSLSSTIQSEGELS